MSASECRRERKKKKRALIKGSKARWLGAKGCAAWKVIEGNNAKQCSVSVFFCDMIKIYNVHMTMLSACA